MKTLTSVALCIVLAVGFAAAQKNSTVDQNAILISKVQQTLASQLDSALPLMPFEKWVRLQVGNDADVAWVVRAAEGHPTLVEVDVSMHGKPGVVIMVACTKPDGEVLNAPKFKSLLFLRNSDNDEWPHLRDLPAAVKRANGES